MTVDFSFPDSKGQEQKMGQENSTVGIDWNTLWLLLLTKNMMGIIV